MKARMNHPVRTVPGVLEPLVELNKATRAAANEQAYLLELLHLRASQINGDSANVDRLPRAARAAGELSDQKLLAVAAWRNTPYFTDAERAVLALTEAMTRVADREDPVPDEVWHEAAEHFGEVELAAIVTSIATVNFWNRLHVVIGQVADPES